ncbi:hypothetical protein XOCgx_3746 [Xanthomonas oryzae pv. oryzicola]|nr:hypothetical protein XOCgx_3746 [Xanthomonas oryzae pv. oryzicola]
MMRLSRSCPSARARSEVSGVSSPTRASDSDARICMAGPACIHGQRYFRRTPCATSSPARACELLLPTHRYNLPAATHRRRFSAGRFSVPRVHRRAARRCRVAGLGADARPCSLASAVGECHSAGVGRVTHEDGKHACSQPATRVPAAVWARAYHDRGLRKEDDLRSVAGDLIVNPLRAGLVERVGDSPFWDAIWLAEERASARWSITEKVR